MIPTIPSQINLQDQGFIGYTNNGHCSYPLIIDPSGQAVDFLMKEFAHKNIQKTSFLDDSFRFVKLNADNVRIR